MTLHAESEAEPHARISSLGFHRSRKEQEAGQQQADQHHPVYQSYIDTCLIGCMETKAENFAIEFIQSTHFWQDYWVNDRQLPQYPRHARLTAAQQRSVDTLLQSCGILQYRREQEV